MSDKLKKPPPVPKFQTTNAEKQVFKNKAQQFIKHVEAAPVQKKKPNLSSINEKLNSMMKNKKDLIDKIKIEAPKITPPPQPKIVIIDQEYNPEIPNHYEQWKHAFDNSKNKSSTQAAPQPQQIIIQPVQAHMDVELSEAEETALKIMKKYGYKIGQGLGKNKQGITTPLITKKITNTSCVVTQSSISLDQLINPKITAKISLQSISVTPTPLIILSNMLNIQDLNQQTQFQIKQQCCKYGSVINWLCYLFSDGLRIFVQYQNQNQSMQAFIHLNQRYYSDRMISVRFYNCQQFKKGNYSMKLHDHVSF